MREEKKKKSKFEKPGKSKLFFLTNVTKNNLLKQFPSHCSTVGMKKNIPGISMMRKFMEDVVGRCKLIISRAFQIKGRRAGQLHVQLPRERSEGDGEKQAPPSQEQPVPRCMMS